MQRIWICQERVNILPVLDVVDLELSMTERLVQGLALAVRGKDISLSADKKYAGKHRNPENLRRDPKVPPRPVVLDKDGVPTKVLKQDWDKEE